MKFKEEIDQIPKELILYFDECGFDINMIKEYGYQLKSQRLLAERSGRRGDRITVIAVRDHNNNLLAPFMFEGYTNKTVVKEYLKKVLLPITKENQVIIMDNAGFHKGDDIQELIESKNCKLKYLPSYSPDLNPIEKKWSQIKSWYRKLTHKYNDKTELIYKLLSVNNYQLFC